MKITMKRLASLAMTGALTLAMTAPAFAVASPFDPAAVAKGNSTKITGNFQKTDIDVLVPGDTKAAIDPYGIGFSINTSTGKQQFSGQIVSAPMAIYNKSALKLDVEATVIGAPIEGSTMKLAAATTKAQGTEGTEGYVPAATTKSAFVQLQVAPSQAAGADEDNVKDTIITECGTAGTWTGQNVVTIPVGTKVSAPQKVATLEKPNVDPDDGSFTAYLAKSIAVFRLTGDCVESPKEAWVAADPSATPAVAGDGFEVNVAFTFKPAASGS